MGGRSPQIPQEVIEMKRGKKYVEAAKAVDRATLYDTAEAGGGRWVRDPG